MGAGSIAVMFWGVPLPDDRADVAYAMREWEDGYTGAKLPGDLPAPNDRGVCIPRERLNGRHWIGVCIDGCSMLPKDMRAAVYPAFKAALTVDVAVRDAREAAAAKASWEWFADWCSRRGVTLPEPGLYVVADYD